VFLFITFKDRILRFVEFDNGGWHFVILYEFQNLLKDNIKPLATHLNFTYSLSGTLEYVYGKDTRYGFL
jgi:hypothetical protein